MRRSMKERRNFWAVRLSEELELAERTNGEDGTHRWTFSSGCGPNVRMAHGAVNET